MSNYHTTINTYDHSAKKVSEYFQAVGSRVEDIEQALELAGNPSSARVVEIGCGDGRDGAEIIRRVAEYIGFDPSRGMLELAHQNVPQVTFAESNALNFSYPENLDVVYSFASLLHSPKEEVEQICHKVENALRPGGVFYIWLKEKLEYSSEMVTDAFGQRFFYYYTIPLFVELAGEGFEKVVEEHQTIGSTNWFTLALRKIDNTVEGEA